MATASRIGLIGYGLAGSAFHAPLISTTDGLELTAIVTRDPERAKQISGRYPQATVVESAEALWDLGLDAVVIATPNTTHAPLALEAIAKKVAVVVDKPMAITSLEAESVVLAADTAGVMVVPFQNRRWDGDFLTLKKLLAENSLGRVARFESRFERWRPKMKEGWRERIGPEEGGGILFDLGAHVIDQAQLLFGPAIDVYAEIDTTRDEAPTDDDSFVALTHANGVRSHLYMSLTAADLGPRFRVLGTKAAYTVYGLDVQEAALRAGELPGPGWGEVPEPDYGILRGGPAAVPVRTEPGNYPAFYHQLSAALAGRGPAPVDPMDAVRTLRTIEAARESSITRQVVTF